MLRILDAEEVYFVAGGMMVAVGETYFDDFDGGFSANEFGDGGGGGGGWADDSGNWADDTGDPDHSPASGREIAQGVGGGVGGALGGMAGSAGGPFGTIVGAGIGGGVGVVAGTALYNYATTPNPAGSPTTPYEQYVQYNSQPGGQYYHDFN